MNKILAALLFISSSVFAGPMKFNLSTKIFDNSKLEFVPHQGTGAFDSYLTMEVKFEPVAELFKDLLIAKRIQLTNRGEAHITVITPVEFTEILKSKITMTEIDEIAKKAKIQSSKFDVVCVGKGSLEIDSKLEQTFYVVVRSPDLLKIREEVKKLFESKGGEKDLFKPVYFYPHITLGFTKRDLHESDGVIKDERTCFGDVKLTK